MTKTFERKSTFTFMLKNRRLSWDGAMTLNIIKLSMKTLSRIKLSISTLRIMALSIMNMSMVVRSRMTL